MKNFLHAALPALLLFSAASSAHEYYADGFTIVHPWALPTPDGETDAGVYLRFEQIQKGDRLLSASSPAARSIRIIQEADGSTAEPARELASLELPVGATVDLHPNALHLQMIDLKAPLSYDRGYPLILVFERAGTIDTSMSVGQH